MLTARCRTVTAMPAELAPWLDEVKSKGPAASLLKIRRAATCAMGDIEAT